MYLFSKCFDESLIQVIHKTNTKVKFWILGNYASPAFRDSLPPLAEKYGFEFEFVQYKWPRWLNAQTEKQRTMWGYKILFLDVLFPLEVDKVSFLIAEVKSCSRLAVLYKTQIINFDERGVN